VVRAADLPRPLISVFYSVAATSKILRHAGLNTAVKTLQKIVSGLPSMGKMLRSLSRYSSLAD
jgi:hypothetical protein